MDNRVEETQEAPAVPEVHDADLDVATLLKRWKSCLWVGAGCILLPNLFWALYYAPPLLQARDSAHWPTTRGVVVSSEVVRSSSGRSVSRWPEIRYEYLVEGRQFKGRRLAFLQDLRFQDRTSEILAQYPPGREVLVHVQPGKPSNATLEVGITAGMIQRVSWMAGGCNLITLSLGGLFLWFAAYWRKLYQQAKQPWLRNAPKSQ